MVPSQLHCAPLAPFVFSSAMVHESTALMGAPVTVACNVTWPLAGIVTAVGETVTVTLLGSNPLPPQPAMTISWTSDPTQRRARDKFITDLQQKDHLNILVTVIPVSPLLDFQAVALYTQLPSFRVPDAGGRESRKIVGENRRR